MIEIYYILERKTTGTGITEIAVNRIGENEIVPVLKSFVSPPPEPSFVRYSGYEQDGLFTRFAMQDVDAPEVPNA